MTGRRGVLRALLVAAVCAPPLSHAQPQRARSYRIGFLGTAFQSGYLREVEWVRAGLRRLGYEEGRNIVIEWRWGEGNDARIRQIAAELVALRVDAILVHNIIGARAAARESASIPIVMADGGDPVAAGLATALARPGRNVTGSVSFVPEESAKRLELLKEVLPGMRHAGFLSSTAQPAALVAGVRKALQNTAEPMKVELHDFTVRDVGELAEAFKAMAAARIDALVVNNEPVLNSQASVIGALALLTRLPAIGYPNFADAGGLLAFGASRPALYGRAGYFLDRIFKGEKPGEIAFEQAAKFDLIANAKTAKALGIAIPSTLKLRLDRMVE